MDKFVVNIIHRPEMVPEYSATVTGQGKEEDIGDKALLTESLDIFKTQQRLAHENGLKVTIQMTYAALFNDEAVELAKHDHEVYGDEIALSLLGLPCEEFREKYKTKDFCIWMFSMEDKKAIVNDVFEKFYDKFGFYPESTGSYYMDADLTNYIKEKYGFQVNINVNFPLIKGAQFEGYINGRGVIRLRQIKYKYFSDIALELWELCNAFFDRKQNINSSAELSDYLLAKNFYIVFEAMIDELLGSNKEKKALDKEFSEQQDGKIVDHLYTYQGLMEAGEDVPTYYIGDSKYYKIGAELGEHSIYKQNTYARNIIQYNLDLWDNLENSKKKEDQPLKLRDKLTEGYNILPNFFISADMEKGDYSYAHREIKRIGEPEINFQFHDRLFDRDTLLLSRYNVNFLFIIALYARNKQAEKQTWQSEVRNQFRKEIRELLNEKYDFYAMKGIGNPLSGEQFITEHNLDIKLEYGAFPDRPYDSPCEYGDPGKINEILKK